MKKRVELPLVEPMYSTYHRQGPCTAIIVNNPTIRNWYLNRVMNLTCSRSFLHGFTSPQISIAESSWCENPYFEQIIVSSRFAKGHINSIIREMIDNGYYVAFTNIDDFYIKNKSWYHERHSVHDGMICGYDQNDKTFCIYAYDSNWRYRKFWTSQRSFNKGRISMLKQNVFTDLYALKASDEVIEFSAKEVYDHLKEYLDSDLTKYPYEEEGDVYGIVVHKFIADYVSKLYTGEIPYNRMDRRVFRLIWEHKKVMLERIILVEKNLGLNNRISNKYEGLVRDAHEMRMLYASHHMKRRDSVLPIIQEKILRLMQDEQTLLERLLRKMERKFRNESVEVSQG